MARRWERGGPLERFTHARARLPKNLVLVTLLWAVSQLDAAGKNAVLIRVLRAPVNTGFIVCID